MKFDFTEEQRLVADSVRRLMQQDYGFEARRKTVASAEGWSREMWAKIAEMGLLALPIPPEHGGFGGRAMDLVSVMEAFGDALLVEPYLSVLVAARLIARCGNEAQKSALLPALADGSLIVVFAHGEAGARYDLARVETRAHDGKVSGQKRGVIHAPCADKLIVSARIGDAVRLFLVDRKDAISRAGVTLDGLRTADIELQGAKAEPLVEGDALGAIEDAADYAAALACAEAVGAMKSANDATLEYLKTRKQFGVPIGAFQALQHRMVAMVIECEQARSMAALACARVDADMAPRERARIVSAAKIKIGDAARRVSQESVQLHGGMGMSDELKVSHTFRRLTAIAREWGDVDHHLERFARASRRPGEADVR